MSSSVTSLAKDLHKILTESDRKTEGYDTQATVLKVGTGDEEGTIWVKIPGGVDATPVRRTIDAKEGDEVQIRVAGGSAWVLGNASRPPTDDTTANYAVNISNRVQKDVTIINNIVANEIEANNARFTSLETDTAEVRDLTAGQLTATVGYITTLNTYNISASDIATDHATVGNLDATYASIDDLEANYATIDDLEANYAHITNGVIDNADIDVADVRNLNANYAHISNGVIDNATINHGNVNNLSANYAHITNGVIDNADIDAADVRNLNANYAHITNGVIDNASISYADVDDLDANFAHITNGVIDRATIGYANVNGLDANYAAIDLANVNNAWINNGLIRDAAISDAQILGVSANKLTAGTIDASNITVTNLNASNITTGTINGQRIGQGSLSLDKLAEDVYTESEVDTIVSGLNDRIDGAIETFTGTVVPTLNNSPANSWTTNKLKDQHVGDVYYVVNNQSQQNGYCYRFTKSGNSYSWQLIKDSDVTAALGRLATAEGKIGQIETFDEQIATFKTTTEGAISTLQTKTTNLETSLGDKVSTSTFNELSQTVSGNSAVITTLSDITANNGLTTSTNITNTVNSVSQTATSNSSKLTNLTSLLQTNADGTTAANDIVHQVSSLDQDLDSITTRVGKTEVQIKSTYATSSSGSTTVNKTATITPAVTGWELYSGASITVKFTNKNTAVNPSLNINSTGAKPIKAYNNVDLTEAEYLWKAGSTFIFTYNGTNWLMQDSTVSTRISSAETAIEQTANNVLIKATQNDTTASQGGQHLIQSLINVAPSGVTIDANKVDISGAAIFTSGRLSETSLNNTYATQANLTTESNQRKAKYGTSSTSYSTRTKVVSCSNFELVAGNEITIKFTNRNTYCDDSVQLNVNSKGAVDVWVANAVTSATNQLLWGAGAYITFRYDGTQFIVLGEPRSWYGESTSTATTQTKTDTTAIDGIVICKGTKIELAMTDTNTNVNASLNLRSTGSKAIYYGTTTTRPVVNNGRAWLAESTATFTFDGQYYRMAGQTVIDGDSIKTGTIDANRIDAATLIANNSLIVGGSDISLLNNNLGYTTDTAVANTYATKTYADAKAKTATDYITYVNATDGIKVHNSGDTTDYVQINSSKIAMYRNNTEKMQLTDTTLQLGDTSNNVKIEPLKITMNRSGTEKMQLTDSVLRLGDTTNNITVDSNGMTVKKDSSTIASYGDSITIGKTSNSRLELDYHSVKAVDRSGEAYFHISDLRDSSGYATIVSNYVGDGTTTAFSVDLQISSVPSVKVDNVEITGYTYSSGTYRVTLPTAPADQAKIVITYLTSSSNAKAYTLGRRGSNNNIGPYSVCTGSYTNPTGYCSFTSGSGTTAEGFASLAEGHDTLASGYYGHAEGHATVASGTASHAEGRETVANGTLCSHAEGYVTTASGYSGTHAEGYETVASGSYAAHAEGYGTTASGNVAHAEGYRTIASGSNSHAEGSQTQAQAGSTHAEGIGTIASNQASHAEGYETVSNGYSSHTEGTYTEAIGYHTHAGGYYTIAQGAYQTVIGKCNIASGTTYTTGFVNTDYLFIIGNGTSDTSRSNALTLAGNGNLTIAGRLTQSSDKRLKDHKNYLGNEAVEFIQHLKPAYFIKDDQNHVGFYAQDIEAVDPWNCMIGEMNGFKTLSYTELIAPLVAYCQHLEARIAELEDK